MNPPQYLKAGDVVEISISKLGTLTSKVVDKQDVAQDDD